MYSVLHLLFFSLLAWTVVEVGNTPSIAYANPATRLVSTSGVDAGDCTVNPCRTIPFAIDQADNGDTIQIASGTYTETFAITSRSGLTIQGENAATTIIQGDRIFTQVTIRSSLSITIRNLTIRDGGPFAEGGGQPEGGGISIFGPHPGSNSVILENLILTGNQASNGGAIGFQGGDLKIINCLISDNVAGNAAGAMIVRNDSTVMLETTTVVDNRANHLVGGVANEAHLTVINSIFWNNLLEQIHTNPAGPPFVVTSVSFSDIQGGHAGIANIDQDPLFVDAPNSNFRLSLGSPGIDAGINTEAPASDLDRTARPIDGDGDGMAVVDMGAFEFCPAGGSCHVVVNHFVSFEPDGSTFDFRDDPTGCPEGFAGKFSFDARLSNTSAHILSDLYVGVTTLTNGNLLYNADGGPGRVGARLTVPQQDGLADGLLNSEEFVDVPFVICLTARAPFTFVVDVFGVVDTSADAQAKALPVQERRPRAEAVSHK
jgi:hypothetical protein